MRMVLDHAVTGCRGASNETGWAMLFCDKTTQHYGIPVTEGERNLLVHWSEIK